MSASCAWLELGSLKNNTILVFPSATRAAICASPPNGPDNIFFTLKPAATALAPVVPVAMILIFSFNKMALFLFKNYTISAFLTSCAIMAISIMI